MPTDTPTRPSADGAVHDAVAERWLGVLRWSAALTGDDLVGRLFWLSGDAWTGPARPE